MKISVLMFCLLIFIGKSFGSAGEINVAISSSPSNLNPFFSTDYNSQNINRLLHISLTDFSKDMTFICVLCDSFSEKFYDDGRYSIVFNLKKDIIFWDGDKVDAFSVKDSIKYYQDKEKIKSIFRFAFGSIINVNVIDKFKVELIYKSFSIEHLSNLTLLKILKVIKTDSKIKLRDIIGAGDYKLEKESEVNVRIIPTTVNKRPIINFKVVKDETTLALKLLNKEIDLSIANMSPRKYFWLKNNGKDLKFWESSSTNYIYLGLNHKKQHLKDVRIREAISLLIPREKIQKYKLKGLATLSNGMFSSAFKEVFRKGKIDFVDIKKAEKYFTAVGWIRGPSGFWEMKGKTFILDWKVSSNKATQEMVTTIKNYLELFGIKVNVTVQEWGTYMRAYKGGNYDIVMAQWIGFTGPDMLKYVFHSKSIPPKGANRGYYLNKKLDFVLDQATAELDRDKRNRLYREAHLIAMEDYAYINLWHPKIMWIGKDCLDGVNIYPNGNFISIKDIRVKCK